MSGGYGSNEWKIRLYTGLAVGATILVIGVVLGGAYAYFEPRYTAYKEEQAFREEQERLEEEQRLKEEEARLEEEQRRAEEEARLAEEAAKKTYVSEYEVVVSDATWLEAQEHAESLGGHLAVITSAEEEQKVEALINQYDYLHTVWLGGTCTNSNLQWNTGESVEYTQWGPGEPNNETGDEIYMDMYEIDNVWHWNDVPNDIKQYYSGKMGYVIEWEVEQ